MKTTTEINREFEAAKQIALTIANNQMRRAMVDNKPVNYFGAKINNRMFVLGDSLNDIQNPDATIAGKPAREIFGDFSIMNK